MAKLVANEQVMVQGGIHSRRTAMDEVGIKDPDVEFSRWLEEREAILKMNRNFNNKAVKSVMRERDTETKTETGDE
jgi:type IV secretory pathway protease TraF